METIKHLVLPRSSNDYKARLIQIEGMIVLTLMLILGQSLLSFVKASKIAVLGYASQISPTEVITLTNEKRKELGLNELTYSDKLAKAAHEKGLDMLAKDYWAHVSPDGTEPWAFFADVGYDYRYAGENLARDFSSPQAAVDAWMASPSHRENMLSPRYREIGVAVVEGDLSGKDTTLIVQLFGTPSQAALVPSASAETNQTQQQNQNVLAQGNETKPVSAATPAPIAGNTQDQAQTAINPFLISRIVAVVAVVGVLGVLLLDAVEISRRGVKRVGSRTLAHLSFMLMVLIIVLVAKAGQIL